MSEPTTPEGTEDTSSRPTMKVTNMDYIPEFVKYFHAFARQGYAKSYGEKFCKFDVVDCDRALFPGLKDVTGIFMVYRRSA